MTGPEHYLEAERLARAASETQSIEQAHYLALRGQLHATLADAAATAALIPSADATGSDNTHIVGEWQDVGAW